MRLVRILLHGLVLLLVTFTGIYAGFIAYHLTEPTNQLLTQLPIAAVLSILLFVLWSLFARVLPFERLFLRGFPEFSWVFLASLLWNPAVLVPVHYLTQGYLTGPGNIIASMVFQVPVNIVALALAWGITQQRARADAGGATAQP